MRRDVEQVLKKYPALKVLIDNEDIPHNKKFLKALDNLIFSFIDAHLENADET